MSAVKVRKSKAPEAIVAKKVSNAKPLTLKPKVSEKGYALSEATNTYIFETDRSANKFDLAAAVAAQFEVEVKRVRIASVPGKTVKSYRQRGRKSISAKRSDVRKAYVTLKEGYKLPIFAAMEEPEAPKEKK